MLSACIIFVHIFTCSIGLWISWMHKVYLFSHLCNKKLLSSYYVKRTRLGTGYMFAASAVTEIQFLSSRSWHFRRKNRHTSKWNVRRGIFFKNVFWLWTWFCWFEVIFHWAIVKDAPDQQSGPSSFVFWAAHVTSALSTLHSLRKIIKIILDAVYGSFHV